MPRICEQKLATVAVCAICKETKSARAMSKHLETHLKQREENKQCSPAFHLRIDGGDDVFWMDVIVPAGASLMMLDRFLRDIWLECCGHLSAFEIEGRQYNVSFSGLKEMDVFGALDGEETMDIPFGKVLRPGLVFSHDYDFGTTTTLRLRVISSGKFGKTKSTIELLARNEPPDMRCESCGQKAVVVCSMCKWNDVESWLCKKCAKKHAGAEDCDGEGFLPVVNSPRVGECGYTG
ncbi:MAG: hypothetical protein WCG83_04985 [Candidatus Peregrinibacteria bacterium]